MNLKLSALLVLIVTLLSCTDDPLTRLDEIFPSPELSINQVVGIQLEALQHNNPDNKGIEIVYRFAAPSNKINTGPLARFTTLFNTGAYSSMLLSRNIELLQTRVQGNIAIQGTKVVSSDGSDVYFLFVLERQAAGEFQNCWMTIAVYNYNGDFPGPDFSVESESI